MNKKIDPTKMNKGDVVLTGMASFMDSWPIRCNKNGRMQQ